MLTLLIVVTTFSTMLNFQERNVNASTIAHDQTATGQNATGATTVTASVSTSGTNRVLIATISYNPGVAGANKVSTVTGGGVTWSRLTGATNSTVVSVEVWKATAAAQITAQTITATLSSSSRATLVISAYTGVDTVNPMGATCTGTGTTSGTNIPTCSITTTYNGSLVLGHIAHRQAPTITAGTGYTLNGTAVTTNATAANNVRGAQERKNAVANIGTYAVSFTNNTAVAWVVLGFELRAAPSYTVSSTGTQTASFMTGATNQYLGGAFAMVADAGSADITQIVLKETGTVNANTSITNAKLYYETAGTCTYTGTEALFGSAASFNASDIGTITGSTTITTSQVCFYVVVDIGSSAANNSTLDIEITNPSTGITVSSGTVSPASAVAIAGSSTLIQPVASVTLTTSGTFGYGTLAANTSANTITLGSTKTFKNDGNIVEDINIKTSNATNGTTWNLGASAGSNTFVHEFSKNSGGLWTKFTTADTYQSLLTGMAVNATQNIDFRITTPTSSSDFVQKSITITLQAVAP